MSNTSKQENKNTPRTKKTTKKAADNLIQLDEKSPERAQPNELNQKISQIDADLDALRQELSSTNKGLKTSLSHLSDKDMDLTSRVSEAYQQLGDLDASYKSLTDKSSRISQEIKAVSKSINEISQRTDADIGTLSEGYQLLVARTEEITQKSKLTTQNLNKSIKENAKAMEEMEQRLLSEIDDLATTSKARDDTLGETTKELGEGLSKAEEEIRSSQARMLKLQAVDQALEKRSDLLETTTEELTKKSRELARSTTALNQRTSQLAEAIEVLQEKTEEHSGLIANLQTRAEKTANALYALIMQEKRHFRLLTGAVVLLLLALAGFLFYENANWEDEAQANASLQAGLNSVSEDLAVTDNEVSRVDNRVTEVESLDGRVTNMRPYRTFGNGNVIHGPEWVAAQPSSQYVIHLATVSDKQTLYTLAERYSHYLKDDLAYLPVTVNGAERFALIYGQFTTEADAGSVLSRMPRYIERQRPAVYPMSRVQGFVGAQAQ